MILILELLKIEFMEEEILEDKNEMILIRKEINELTLDPNELQENHEYAKNANLKSIKLENALI